LGSELDEAGNVRVGALAFQQGVLAFTLACSSVPPVSVDLSTPSALPGRAGPDATDRTPVLDETPLVPHSPERLALLGASPEHCSALLQALSLPTRSIAEVSRASEVFAGLAQELPGPDLANVADELSKANAFLVEALSLAPDDDETLARGRLRVANTQLAHTRSFALAKCFEDPSRDQSESWRARLNAELERIRPSLIGCFVPRPLGGEGQVILRVRIVGSRVVAGPVRYSPTGSGVPLEIVICTMTVLESMKLPPPTGVAILQIPLVRDE
jgi:hypothetical protein